MSRNFLNRADAKRTRSTTSSWSASKSRMMHGKTDFSISNRYSLRRVFVFLKFVRHDAANNRVLALGERKRVSRWGTVFSAS